MLATRATRLIFLVAFITGTSLATVADAKPDQRRFIVVNVRRDNQFVSGASLELFRNGKKMAVGTTNAEGAYTFPNLDTGKYEVKASKTINGVRFQGSLTRNVNGLHSYVFRIDLQR